MPLELIDRTLIDTLSPERIEELFAELRKTIEDDPILREYRDAAKALGQAERPGYTPTIIFEYKLSTA